MAKKRRSYRHYFRRAKHRASKFTLPLALTFGIVGMPAISNAAISLSQGNIPQAIDWLKSMVGITPTGTFDQTRLMANVTPLAAGLIVHKAAGYLGVNRALAKAKIPIIRI